MKEEQQGGQMMNRVRLFLMSLLIVCTAIFHVGIEANAAFYTSCKYADQIAFNGSMNLFNISAYNQEKYTNNVNNCKALFGQYLDDNLDKFYSCLTHRQLDGQDYGQYQLEKRIYTPAYKAVSGFPETVGSTVESTDFFVHENIDVSIIYETPSAQEDISDVHVVEITKSNVSDVNKIEPIMRDVRPDLVAYKLDIAPSNPFQATASTPNSMQSKSVVYKQTLTLQEVRDSVTWHPFYGFVKVGGNVTADEQYCFGEGIPIKGGDEIEVVIDVLWGFELTYWNEFLFDLKNGKTPASWSSSFLEDISGIYLATIDENIFNVLVGVDTNGLQFHNADDPISANMKHQYNLNGSVVTLGSKDAEISMDSLFTDKLNVEITWVTRSQPDGYAFKVPRIIFSGQIRDDLPNKRLLFGAKLPGNVPVGAWQNAYGRAEIQLKHTPRILNNISKNTLGQQTKLPYSAINNECLLEYTIKPDWAPYDYDLKWYDLCDKLGSYTTFECGDPNLDSTKSCDGDFLVRAKRYADGNEVAVGEYILKVTYNPQKDASWYSKLIPSLPSGVKWAVGGISSVFAQLFAGIFDAVFQQLFGFSYADIVINGKIPEQEDGMVPYIFNLFISDYWQYATQAILILFLVITGIVYMAGLAPLNQQDGLVRVLKVGLVFLVVQPDSWRFVYENLLQMVFTGGYVFMQALNQKVIINTLSIDGSSTINNDLFMFEPLAQIFAIASATSTWERILAYLFSSGLGVLLLVVLVICMISSFLLVLRIVLIYLVSYIFLGLLFLLAPIYICFILFKKTKSYFDGWFKAIIALIIQPLGVFLSFAITSQIIILVLHSIFSVTTCPVCLVSIFAHCIFPVHKIAMSMGGASISLGMLWAAAVGLLILLQTQHTIMHTISDISNQLATGQYAGWDTSGTAEKLGPKETASRIQSDVAKAGVRRSDYDARAGARQRADAARKNNGPGE
jgi:type IV secretory pathway VirB6-like protein